MLSLGDVGNRYEHEIKHAVAAAIDGMGERGMRLVREDAMDVLEDIEMRLIVNVTKQHFFSGWNWRCL